jgi:hypothetical protein
MAGAKNAVGGLSASEVGAGGSSADCERRGGGEVDSGELPVGRPLLVEVGGELLMELSTLHRSKTGSTRIRGLCRAEGCRGGIFEQLFCG